jgi:hypothetical protein
MDVLMETNTAGLGITHTNAQGGILNRRLLERVRTKIVISRPDPSAPKRLRIECDKSDDKLPAPLGAAFTDTAVEYDRNPPSSPETPRGRKPSSSPGMAEFLETFLQAGPAPVVEIVKAARDKGLLKAPTNDAPKPSISPLYNARGWFERSHPEKLIDEFSLSTASGGQLKHWAIVDKPEPASRGGT